MSLLNITTITTCILQNKFWFHILAKVRFEKPFKPQLPTRRQPVPPPSKETTPPPKSPSPDPSKVSTKLNVVVCGFIYFIAFLAKYIKFIKPFIIALYD